MFKREQFLCENGDLKNYFSFSVHAIHANAEKRFSNPPFSVKNDLEIGEC